MQLNQQQQKAFDKYVQFLLDDSESIFHLEGFSGTGKTFAARKFIQDTQSIISAKYLLIGKDDPSIGVYVLAPTNEAVANFKDGFDEKTQKMTTFSTLAAFLQIVPKNSSDSIQTYTTMRGAISLSDDLNIIFVDEASMLDLESEWEFGNLAKESKKNKIVYLYDRTQLKASKLTSQLHHNKPKYNYLLDKIERSMGNLTDLNLALRNGVLSHQIPNISSLLNESITLISPSSVEDRLEQLVGEEKFQNGGAKVLTYTRDTAVEVSGIIRKKVHEFHNNVTNFDINTPFSPNEFVMSQDSFKALLNIELSLLDDIHEIRIETDTKSTCSVYGVSSYEVLRLNTLGFKFDKLHTRMTYSSTVPLNLNYIKEVNLTIVDIRTNNTRSEQIVSSFPVKLYRHKDKVFVDVPVHTKNNILNYFARNKLFTVFHTLKAYLPSFYTTYAITTHKAQGRTYTDTLIPLNDMQKALNRGDLDTYLRLLNVAGTRASNSVTFIGG